MAAHVEAAAADAPSPFTAALRDTWGVEGHLDAAQASALAELKPAYPDVADFDLLRWLRANKFDVTAAAKAYDARAAWAAEWKPASIGPSDVPVTNASGATMVSGHTREGAPLCEVRCNRWNPRTLTRDEQKRTWSLLIEAALARDRSGARKIVVVFDMDGWGVSMALPHPMALVFDMVTMVQSNYPEHLGAVLLINVPWVFRATWAVIARWLDQRTACKVHLMAAGAASSEALAATIDDDNLSADWGGTRPVPEGGVGSIEPMCAGQEVAREGG